MPPFFASPTAVAGATNEDRLTLLLLSALSRDEPLLKEFARLFGYALPFREASDDVAGDYVRAVDEAEEVRVDFHRALKADDIEPRIHWPDLTISGTAGDKPSVQLLVECKVEARLGWRKGPDTDAPNEQQLVAYARAWRQRDGQDEAPIRRIAPLTVDHLEHSGFVGAEAPWISKVRALDTGCSVEPSASSVRWLETSLVLEDAADRLHANEQAGDAKACADLVDEIRRFALPAPNRTFGARSGVLSEQHATALATMVTLRHRARVGEALNFGRADGALLSMPWAEADLRQIDEALDGLPKREESDEVGGPRDLGKRAILLAYGGDLDAQRTTEEIAAAFGSFGDYREWRDKALRHLEAKGFPEPADRPGDWS